MNQDTGLIEGDTYTVCGCKCCEEAYLEGLEPEAATTDHDIMRAQPKAAEERVESLEKENIKLQELEQEWRDKYQSLTTGTDIIMEQALTT